MAIKWEWQLKNELGAGKLEKLTAGAAATAASALGTGMAFQFVLDTIAEGSSKQASWNTLKPDVDRFGKELASAVGTKRLSDCLPVLGVASDKVGIEISLQGQTGDFNEKNLTKALEALPEGRFLLFLSEKTPAKGFWYTCAVDVSGAKGCVVFDPFAGQFTEKKRSDAARHLVQRSTDTNKVGAKLESYFIVKATLGGGFDMASLNKKLATAAASIAKTFQTETDNELKKESSSNWFGRDFTRFLDGYRIVKDGKVVRERFTKADGKTVLGELVSALGATWTVPTDAKVYDASQASGGPLEKLVGDTLKNKDELYKVMSLMSQKGMTAVASAFNNAAGIEPKMRFAGKNAAPERWDDTDKWSIDVEVTAATVKVVHWITLIEGFDAKQKFKVKLALERNLDRKKGDVKCATPRAEGKLG